MTQRKIFVSNGEIIAEKRLFEELDKASYLGEVKKLEKR